MVVWTWSKVRIVLREAGSSMGFRLQLDFLAKQHMTAANLSSIEAAPFAFNRLKERLSASYAAHCETPSGGGSANLLQPRSCHTSSHWSEQARLIFAHKRLKEWDVGNVLSPPTQSHGTASLLRSIKSLNKAASVVESKEGWMSWGFVQWRRPFWPMRIGVLQHSAPVLVIHWSLLRENFFEARRNFNQGLLVIYLPDFWQPKSWADVRDFKSWWKKSSANQEAGLQGKIQEKIRRWGSRQRFRGRVWVRPVHSAQ